MSPRQQLMAAERRERLDILRRIGERGLKLAQTALLYPASEGAAHKQHLDLWQHLLDELKRVPSTDEGAKR